MAIAEINIERNAAEPRFAALAAAVSLQWGDTILRLTKATNRLSSQIDQFLGAKTKGETVTACRKLAQELINFLDEMGGDTDEDSAVDDEACCDNELEVGEGDDEPSLGSHVLPSGAISYSMPIGRDGSFDCEGDEHDGREPEDEDDSHDGREPDREESPGFGEGAVDQTVNPPYGGGDGIGGVL